MDRYNMDGHKLIWHLDRVNDWLKGKRIPPIHIDVGLSKGCNIKCEYCFGVIQGNFYKKGAKTFFRQQPLLRYFRDAADVGVRSLAIIGEAEPTLNPHLYEAIIEGKKRGIDISLGTNGVLFDTSDKGKESLSNLTWLRFNISAASDKAYRRIHGSKDFSKFIEVVKFCVKTKKERNLDTTLGFQMVLTPNNVDQVVPLAKLGKKLGVDYLVIKQCSDSVANTIGVYDRLTEYHNFSNVLTEAESMSTADYDVIPKWSMINNEGKREYDQCLGTPFLLYSSGNGRLYPCGMFFEKNEAEYRMGDLVKQSFKEIIESDRYWEVIEKVKEINVHECYSNCRTHFLNDFLWKLKRPPKHANFV